MSEYDAAFIYMPLEQAQLFFGRDDTRRLDRGQARQPRPRIDQLKPRSPRPPGPAPSSPTGRDRNRSFFNALQVERNVMRLILMLIVAIAAMNIISGLVMLVKNKGRDIAILRTMGASQGVDPAHLLHVRARRSACSAPWPAWCSASLFCIYIDQIQDVRGVDDRRRRCSAPTSISCRRIPAKIDWSEVAIDHRLGAG